MRDVDAWIHRSNFKFCLKILQYANEVRPTKERRPCYLPRPQNTRRPYFTFYFQLFFFSSLLPELKKNLPTLHESLGGREVQLLPSLPTQCTWTKPSIMATSSGRKCTRQSELLLQLKKEKSWWLGFLFRTNEKFFHLYDLWIYLKSLWTFDI